MNLSASDIKHFQSHFLKLGDNECWQWLGCTNPKGYGQLRLTKGGVALTHRISYTLFKSEIPPQLCVLHSCDNPSCVNPAHLWVGTYKQNTADMIEKGRMAAMPPSQGSSNPSAKLNECQVLEIRASKKSNQELAKIYNVSTSTLWLIKTRRKWTHI